jgi:hypothetical protein
MRIFSLRDIHYCPMRRVLLEESASEEAPSFHQCERRDCNRNFHNGHGYSDFGDGQFDATISSSRECRKCGGSINLALVERAER